MRPATSGRSVTDSSERRLPTAVIPCGIGAYVTFAACTVTPATWPPGAAAPLPPAPPPAGAMAPVAAGAPLRCCPNQ